MKYLIKYYYFIFYSEFKARIIIPENGDNDIIKFIVSNHQDELLYYDILSLFMFHSSMDKIYKDIHDDYNAIKVNTLKI